MAARYEMQHGNFFDKPATSEVLGYATSEQFIASARWIKASTGSFL